MFAPEYYNNSLSQLCKNCLQDLITLLSEKGIKELDVSRKVCESCEADRCYCNIYDEYVGSNVEAPVERVYLKERHLSVNYMLEDILHHADLQDLQERDILSIYDTCYSILLK